MTLAANPSQKTEQAPASNLADDAPHLLVVDDDRRIRALLSRFLRAEGYRVSTAETVQDARAKLEGLNFDLLVLDVMMPGESGFDFAAGLIDRTDLDADRTRREGKPDHGIGNWR